MVEEEEEGENGTVGDGLGEGADDGGAANREAERILSALHMTILSSPDSHGSGQAEAASQEKEGKHTKR